LRTIARLAAKWSAIADPTKLAEIPDLPGVLAYVATPTEAIAHVQALGLRAVADRVEYGEEIPAGAADRFAVSP
jgi:predicted RNase H-like HicB family nuclease